MREFADLAGVSARMVSRWEACGADITPRQATRAALDEILAAAPLDARLRFTTPPRHRQRT